MGLLLGVAQGSAEPPRLIVLRYEPAGRAGLAGARARRQGRDVRLRRHLDQAGRRHGADEERHGRRRGRRGGAAARWRASSAPFRVIGVIPTVENMPGGRATRPGDVVRGASGKTVEIINTDAEGRLILGDALWYAQQLGATHLVDVATLTGACVVALGRHVSGLFGQPDDVGRDRATRPRRARAIASGRCRSTRKRASSCAAKSPTSINSAGRPGGADHRRGVSARVRRRRPVGASRHRRHGVGRIERAVPAEGRDGRRRSRTLIELGDDAGAAQRTFEVEVRT